LKQQIIINETNVKYKDTTKYIVKMSDLCEIYCLNYKNEERRALMQERFSTLNLKCNFYDGVDTNVDERITKYEQCYKQCWSCMYGHLDMINKFLNETTKEFGIFCEDDIYIRKDFGILLQDVTIKFREMNLDVLILGYLTSHKVEHWHDGYSYKHNSIDSDDFKYHNYPDHVWGTQMYMISRSYAKFLIDKYYTDYAEKSLEGGKPFSADWTITKDGNRCLIFPMLAVEDGKTRNCDLGQDIFHQSCHLYNYNPDLFI
jgi:GR25 family glycosyltransferase involved in LPS biosynthesis